MNKLLATQIKKYLKEKKTTPQLERLLDEINASYDSFEKRLTDTETSLETSAQELKTTKKKLQNELSNQGEVLRNLTAAIAILQEDEEDIGFRESIEDTFQISAILTELVAKYKVSRDRLTQQNQELQKINDLMISRELKMVKLKLQIEDLKKQIEDLKKNRGVT